MSANGSYQQNGDQLSFSPQDCQFKNGLGDKVKLFPIPNESAVTDKISFSPWEGQSQISLKDAASNDQWGLKPGAQESLNRSGSPAATTAKADSPGTAVEWSAGLWGAAGERGEAVRLVPALFVKPQAAANPPRLAASASPEAIFERLSNDLEKEFYKESTPTQRRLILEHFADRFHRLISGKRYSYDDFDEDISTEAMFKALAYPELLDVYNVASLDQQCVISSYGYARWIEFEMGIKLSLDQEDRAARARVRCHRL